MLNIGPLSFGGHCLELSLVCISLTCYVEQALRLAWNVWICRAVVFLLPFWKKFQSFRKPGSCLSLQVMWSASIWVQCLLSIGQIINPVLGQNISCHLYASDILLYCSFKASKIHKLSSVINCLTSMKQWLSDNYTCSWTLITLAVSLSPQTVLFLRLSSTLVL